MRLAEIWCYPVKSCAGVALSSAEVGLRGIRHDRHWMLVDEAGIFVSQRQLPRLALVRPVFAGEGITLEAPGMRPLAISPAEIATDMLEVKIWQDLCAAATAGSEADRWFSAYLDRAVRLVYLPDTSRRPVSPDYAGPDDQMGFADGFPFLLIGRASLHDLGARMGVELIMRRFRPNLVVEGATPYAEDGWRHIQIGDIPFGVAKPCSRCAITTVNPDTGERDLDTLGALAAYRRRDNKVYFGQNLIHDALGELRVGQVVSVIEAV